MWKDLLLIPEQVMSFCLLSKQHFQRLPYVFLLTLSQSSTLYAPTKCHSHSDSLPMVVNECIPVALNKSFMHTITYAYL